MEIGAEAKTISREIYWFTYLKILVDYFLSQRNAEKYLSFDKKYIIIFT